MANQLSGSKSPYLLQHQHNPVDWYPWGPAALERARREDKPVFLSIGYAACHWCHVMERESFENPQIAEILIERFICIKVDREERPDIDQIYMTAVQMLTGSGGWPMSVFLTPDGRPFYGGTYFPPRPKHGLPGFGQLALAIDEAWQERRPEILGQADVLTTDLRLAVTRAESADSASTAGLSLDLLLAAGERLVQVFDRDWGGFGQAPKFPHVSDLELLLQIWARTKDPRFLNVVTVTLDQMATGGIYDHLAGGFARYSVDRQWLVPHFEKMLYDNALLAGVYLRAYQATKNESYAKIARETLEYLLRELSDDKGGLHSSEDADSEGVEGKYYVWSRSEILEKLGLDRGTLFCQVYGVTSGGNFEGANILHLSRSIATSARELSVDVETLTRQLDEDRLRLREARASRIRPGRDDKVLTSWNALAIESLAVGGCILGSAELASAATSIAEFLWNKMRGPDGRLFHASRHGEPHLDGYLDDYAYFSGAMLVLYETTGDSLWLRRCIEIARMMLLHFHDPVRGGLYYTADDHEVLVARPKDYIDASVPSAGGAAAWVCLRLGQLTGDNRWHIAAEGVLGDAAGLLQRQPAAAGQLLRALDLYFGPSQQMVIVADSDGELSSARKEYHAHYRPRGILVTQVADRLPPSDIELLLKGKTLVEGKPTLYECENFRCRAPVIWTQPNN